MLVWWEVGLEGSIRGTRLGLATLVIWGARLKDAVMKRELVVAILASVAVVATLDPGYINAQLTAFNHAEVLELRESKDATFVVLGYDMDGPEPFVQLLANGTSTHPQWL